MQLGMVGLGRMGANMVRRLMKDGHDCVVYDVNAEPVKELTGEGATGTDSWDDFVAKLDKPRNVWLMVPAAFVESTAKELADRMDDGDTLIDGGNSYYHDDIRRAGELRPKGIHYVDVGVSGGVWGLDNGYCQMIGGEPDVVARLAPLFAALAPGAGAQPDERGTAPLGYLHCGASGAGHFVKMVHNGIEYGMLQAYAEGFAIMHAAEELDLDLHEIASIWRTSRRCGGAGASSPPGSSI